MDENKKFKYNVNEIDSSYNFFVFNASTIINPKNNSIIFLKKNKIELLEKLCNIKESILIIIQGMDAEYLKKENLVIYSKNPRLEYAVLMTKILKLNKKDKKFFLKDGYYYGENCNFGDNLLIEPFVRIGNNVKIGNGTIIRSGATIGDNVVLGKNCYIKENCVIGSDGFGIETNENGENIRIPHIGGVEIGDNVEIGALTTVCSGTIESTKIEKNVKIDDHVHIAHNVKVGKGSLIVAGTVIGGSTIIGENSWLGINSAIKNGLILGKNIKLGMASVVIRNLEENLILTSEESDILENVIKYKKYKKKILEIL
ncbi:UDP-3-O-(3-hydroxymyristoyl) glucosamine N-acyltransferase [Fusobacterium necrophorum BFTR-1]|uniref:UDP-3-O-(3-hydroxymyristoyl)glucosamine N-acyltransferase n=1 Tax=Fusobacterium necrophorum TaxID=859 RepID=UPI000461D5B4|nr:UDP-3-O-(3-hydroxymyristoyl)glucosamine N-acyltransferase [Fusobacterium necrophorum]KDE60630.1 UDP-3-O-(3-hydroxymyristoyl) glucosamine N-acyltransferase [Fusobacterium necrophorum BFTR-1]